MTQYVTILCLLSGSAVATTLGKGFLAIRKAGHLCIETQTQDYSDYSGREKLMEVRLDVLRPGTHVPHVKTSTICGIDEIEIKNVFPRTFKF